MLHYSSTLCLLLLLHLSGVSPQLCNVIRNISTVRVLLSPFRGSIPINPSTVGCTIDGTDTFCSGQTILNDNNLGPRRPDLSNGSDNNQFAVWGSSNSFISVEVGTQNVSAIDIYLLSYPAENFGVPNFELYATSQATERTPGQTAEMIQFDLLNNDQLSQMDTTFRKITLRPREPFSSPAILLRWTFTGLCSVQWLGISEIRFCGDNQSDIMSGAVTFQTPATENVALMPTPVQLQAGSLALTCTVSSQGSFTWQWRIGSELVRTSSKISTTTCDGTRTSMLTIDDLNFNDGDVYSCEVSSSFQGLSPQTRSYDIQFPTLLNVEPSPSTGFIGDGFVTLVCEVSGYISSSSPLTWTANSGANLTDPAKYVINVSSSDSNTLIYPNGTVQPAIVSSLTINELTMEDGGNYLCSFNGRASVSQLTIMGGTAPPTDITDRTTEVPMETTFGGGVSGPGGGTATNSGSQTAVVAGVAAVLVIVIILVVIAIVFLMVFMRVRKSKMEAPIGMHRRKTSVNDSSEMQQKLTKSDIVWPSGDGEVVIDGEGAVYDTIPKSRQPSLNFIETNGKALSSPPNEPPPFPRQDNIYIENNTPLGSPSKSTSDIPSNIYAEAEPIKRDRCMTNSSSPKLAKLKASSGTVALDQNPIYESSGNINSNDREALVQPEAPEKADVVYAQPTKPKSFKKKPVEAVSEPVYSEALTPAMFHQQQQSDSSQTLHPLGPVYAEPTIKKKEQVKLVDPSNFEEHGIIGMGQFGEVVLANTVNLSRSDLGLMPSDNDRNVPIKVAIKKLQGDAESSLRDNFEKEIKFMSTLRDPNIVMLLAVHKGQEPFIVMEYMENGDLHQYLEEYDQAVSSTSLVPGQIHISVLVYMALQVANGMRYLASHNYVHRDLATRNCLVGKDFTVKIADFGMSRKLYGGSYYKVKGRALLPIRWMASESFYGKFSEKTDVWSFGVVMWEIFTLCKNQPFEELEDFEMIQDATKEGGRKLLEQPQFCPSSVYDVMLSCWATQPQHRACFRDIAESLTAIYKTM